MNRISIQTETHFVEFPDTHAGAMQAKAFRKSHPQFKRRKLRYILQAYPSKIEVGTIYEFS